LKFFICGIASITIIFIFSILLIGLSGNELLSAILGWSISFLYILTGFILFKKALKFKNKSFGKMVTLSVFGRLIFALIAVYLSVRFFELNSMAFIVTLISFYFVFQIIEIVGLNKISLQGA
jgi:hypothetical protein